MSERDTPRCSITGNPCGTDTWCSDLPPDCHCGRMVAVRIKLQRDLAAREAELAHLYTCIATRDAQIVEWKQRATEAESMVAAIEDYNCESDGCLLGSDEAFKVAQRYRTAIHEMKQRAEAAERKAEESARDAALYWKGRAETAERGRETALVEEE